ncbi:hypothetical protein Aglo01_24550 [Actinokineospora globicatena]|nr:hypothetical protein Aglo01_24550 [Actinokineospora globicatena]
MTGIVHLGQCEFDDEKALARDQGGIRYARERLGRGTCVALMIFYWSTRHRRPRAPIWRTDPGGCQVNINELGHPVFTTAALG